MTEYDRGYEDGFADGANQELGDIIERLENRDDFNTHTLDRIIKIIKEEF